MKETPFKVGGLVEPPYFVGREEELAKLCDDARNLTQNNLILAPRRYGKSSLLHNLKLNLQQESGLLIPYVNCREIASYADFYRATVMALLSEYERKTRIAGLLQTFRVVFKAKFLKAIKQIEEVGGSLDEVGRMYLRFREQAVDERELVQAAFRFFRSFAQEKDARILFLLDEFQEAAEFNGYLFNLFKKELDEAPTIRYFFSGSSMKMLSDIFLREDAPLYLMVSRHYMKALQEDDIVSFIQERLAIVNFSITQHTAKVFHKLTGGIPYYIQKLGVIVAQSAMSEGKTTVTPSHVDNAFAAMLEELDSEFEVRWLSRFSNQQRRIVQALSELGEARLKDIAAEMMVHSSDISSAISRLKDMMILQRRENGSYYITDRVFAAWIASM